MAETRMDDKIQKKIKPSSGKRRSLEGVSRWVIGTVAVGLSLFQLYFSTFGMIDTMAFRSGHLIMAMIVIFGVYPARKGAPSSRLSVVDIVLCILAVVVGIYIIQEWDAIVYRQGAATQWDIILGCIATLLTIEIARRTTGWALPGVAALFLGYTYFGPYFPGNLAHIGFPIDRLVGQLYTTTEGLYGLPLGVMVNYVFLFILFAAFLNASGAGSFFIRLAYALTGHFRGGPAKTAVVASGMMATITGASTANVVSTGAFTIPLMKEAGYKPETAGGIEVASSVGGQLTPPIMGAGAFIMAEWTGVPYLEIIKIAAIPALAYYLSVFFYVHLMAVKNGIEPLAKEDTPDVREVFKEGGHLFVPLVVLVGMLIYGYTPMTSVIYGIVSLIVVANLRRHTRLGWKAILRALENGTYNAVLVSASLACAGILMCTIGLTGVGLKFSAIVMEFSGGNILLGVALVAVASLFLGMELPITAAYIAVAVMTVPALKALGIPLIAAHMIVFWFSMDSSITPPVCVSAYAASGISGGHPLKTGIAAWKMAKALYIIPIYFAYTEFLTGSIGTVLLLLIPVMVSLIAFSIAWEGFLLQRLNVVERLMMMAAVVMSIYPHTWSHVAGVVVFAVLVGVQVAKNRRADEPTVLVRGGGPETERGVS